MMQQPWLCLLVVSCVVGFSEGKRVVILPMPHISHTRYLINVARELVNLGHEVWMTMPDYLATLSILDTTNLSVIEHSPKENVQEISLRLSRDQYFNGQPPLYMDFFELMKRYSDTLLTNETFFLVLKNLHPDLFLIDNISIKMLSVIPYRLGVPFAFLGTVYEPIWQRVPLAPAVFPIPMMAYTDHMLFFERVINTLVTVMNVLQDKSVYSDAVRIYAPDMPYLPLDMLVARAEIWLVETDHILDYPRPSMPNVKLIGGTATGPAKPLPPEFQTFMDSASQGVIIISFGSYVLDLPKDVSVKIMTVLQQLPMKSIFRSNLPSPDPEKILTSSWIPQNDLLGHHNTKVFVSHCGKNGQYEALYHAVPVVAAPMFADQAYNAERMRVKGFSETIDILKVTEEELRDVIVQVAMEKYYKDNISKASELFQIEFGVPMKTAAFWLDHVMKYGSAHMRSGGQDIRYYQFLGLDIAVFFVAVFIIFVLAITCCCRCTYKYVCQRKHKKD